MSESNSKYNVSVRISDDYYKAYLSVEFYYKDVVVKPEELVKILKEKNIIFGIKYNVIESICKNKETVFNELVAEGIPHIHGADARVEYAFDKDYKAKPQIMEDGRVDFKNMGFVEMVHAGDLLATKIPLTKAKAGTTVTGKTIAGKNGKEIVLKLGKNVSLSSDGLRVISDVDGTVTLEGDKITVSNLLELKKDIGVETGNISFQGQVIVNGNVTNGYAVECEGDLIINGVVEGAILKSNGNIVISRGIQGHDQADISCEGNLTANFINSANVYCKGDIETGAIMNSNVKCDGNISVKGKKGLIVGGEVTSKKDIEAVTVGSEMGIITSIKLGVDVEVIEELKQLTGEVKDMLEMHEKLEKSLKLLKVKIEQSPSDERSIFMYGKLKSNFDEVDASLNDKRQRLRMLNELINNIRGAQLKAKTIYPGTRVKIGNASYYVKHALSYSIITKDRGEIVAIGY